MGSAILGLWQLTCILSDERSHSKAQQATCTTATGNPALVQCGDA